MVDDEIYFCQYYSTFHAKKNGKPCLLDPEHPKRCMDFLYETETCESKEEVTNMNKITKIEWKRICSQLNKWCNFDEVAGMSYNNAVLYIKSMPVWSPQ